MSGKRAESIQDLTRQLEAAEKTNSILKHKVIDLYNSGAQSVIHKQLENARKRDEENRRRHELMEVRNQELKRYSETLEAEVAARTESMKTILNNVKFGFLMTDQQLHVHEEYTKTCEHLFGQTKLGGQILVDLLRLNGRHREHYRLCIDQVFEDILPSEVTLAQIPKRFELGDRILKVEASVIRKDGQVASLLYTLSDITDLEMAQNEARINLVLVRILKQKDAFFDYVAEVKDMLRTCLKLLDSGDQRGVRLVLHTLKGNTASWELSDIAAQVHDIEDSPVIEARHVNEIDQAFRRFLKTHHSVIGIDYDDIRNETFAISSQQIEDLRSLLSHMQNQEAAPLRDWTAQILQKPASSLLGPIEEFTLKLAERLGKRLNVELKGQDTLVDVESTKGILQNMVHLLRNAVDHGIEFPIEREGSKPKTGRIAIEIRHERDFYVFEVQDDGRGIDLPKLLEKAISRGIITAEQAKSMPRPKQLELIFVDGLSSADQTTEISGRGIGMSAMMDAVRRASGHFEVDTEEGRGTTMRIRIPVPDVLKVRKAA